MAGSYHKINNQTNLGPPPPVQGRRCSGSFLLYEMCNCLPLPSPDMQTTMGLAKYTRGYHLSTLHATRLYHKAAACQHASHSTLTATSAPPAGSVQLFDGRQAPFKHDWSPLLLKAAELWRRRTWLCHGCQHQHQQQSGKQAPAVPLLTPCPRIWHSHICQWPLDRPPLAGADTICMPCPGAEPLLMTQAPPDRQQLSSPLPKAMQQQGHILMPHQCTSSYPTPNTPTARSTAPRCTCRGLRGAILYMGCRLIASRSAPTEPPAKLPHCCWQQPHGRTQQTGPPSWPNSTCTADDEPATHSCRRLHSRHRILPSPTPKTLPIHVARCRFPPDPLEWPAVLFAIHSPNDHPSAAPS
jgi:hypothetical protein